MTYTNKANKQLDKLGQLELSDLLTLYELDAELLDVDIKIGFVEFALEGSKHKMRRNKYLFKNKFFNILG